jgi:uncharacterized membrane protein YtjA (UPF0391 family)
VQPAFPVPSLPQDIARETTRCGESAQEDYQMLRWAVIFLVIALIAGLLGFTGLAAAAAGIAKFLFYLFLIVCLVLFIAGFMAAKKL